ncbi:hypothetical protein ACJX0J_031578 [Zea mays]
MRLICAYGLYLRDIALIHHYFVIYLYIIITIFFFLAAGRFRKKKKRYDMHTVYFNDPTLLIDHINLSLCLFHFRNYFTNLLDWLRGSINYVEYIVSTWISQMKRLTNTHVLLVLQIFVDWIANIRYIATNKILICTPTGNNYANLHIFMAIQMVLTAL